MKKKLFTLLALIVCLSITGCNDESPQNAQSESKQVQEQTNETIHNSVEQKDSDDSVSESPANKEAINNDVESVDKISTGFSTEYTIENAKDGYFIVSKLDGALYGLLDSYGTEVIPLEYDSIVFPESKNAKAVIVQVEGKKGLLDYEGNEILPIEYEDISNYGSNSSLYLAQEIGGPQNLVKLDGTIQKTLQGTYDAILNDDFLVSKLSQYLTTYSCQAIYNLDEQLLYECKYESNQKSEYDYILFIDNVDGLIKLFKKSPEIYASIMDDSGNILFTTSNLGANYWDINSLQDNNLFRVSGTNQDLKNDQCLYDLSTGEIREQGYDNIVRADEDTVLASRKDGNVDVYNLNGDIEDTLEINADGLIIVENSALIVAKYGETYRIYNKEGVEISDERYLSVESIDNFWVLQNLNGEYGLMDAKGEMCISFGQMGEKSYNGLEWKNTYIFDDTFCIVTESSSGSNVWLFSSAS